MQDFTLWLSTGMQHILDWKGYDHIAYVIALTACFSYNEWKKLLILITAFTIGHSFTLAMSTLNIFTVKQSLIEVLIPVTILVTCITNLSMRNKINKSILANYITALCFGFIHGMGFSYLLKSMLGHQTNIVLPLLGFNLGLEIGQLIVVVFILIISLTLSRFLRLSSKHWIIIVSSLVGILSCYLIIQRLSLIAKS